jgi:hypothetical protein
MVLLVSVCFWSCHKSEKKPTLKNASGNAGELVIVINKEIWNSTTDTLIRSLFSQEQLGLPQPEPIFDVINIPHNAFGDIFKTTRNLVITKIDQTLTEPSVTFQRDVYAATQALVTVSARNTRELNELFKKNGDKMVGFFLKAERERIIYNYANFNEKSISKKTNELFGFTLSIPPGYKVDKASGDFMWIRYETPEISQGILVYSFPYESDNTFTLNYLVAKRNIVLKNNVPGPSKDSYMTTESAGYPLLFNRLQFKGNYAAELRGLWRLENDFMGGPFVSLFVLDLLKKRVVVLDGYVYAPSKEKRNFMRQIEGIIYSAQFTDQLQMDKLNKQFKE